MAGLKQFVIGLIREYDPGCSKQIAELANRIEIVSNKCTENNDKIGYVDVETDGDLQQQVNRKNRTYIEETLEVDPTTDLLTDGSKPTTGDLIFDKTNTTLWFVQANGVNHQIKLS